PPRGWLFLGVAALVPGFLRGDHSQSTIALALGGIVMGFSAMTRLAAVLPSLADALVAWTHIAPLVRAARREPLRPAAAAGLATRSRPAEAGDHLIQARALSYRYRAGLHPVIRDCDLTVRAGDRVLLEGPSGSGKSTLVALLAGLREPESGV